MAFRVPATGSLTRLAKSAPSAIMRGFIGGSPRMAILSNGSGAEASSPLEKTSAGGQARRPISKSRFSRNGIFACPSAAFSGCPENAPRRQKPLRNLRFEHGSKRQHRS